MTELDHLSIRLSVLGSEPQHHQGLLRRQPCFGLLVGQEAQALVGNHLSVPTGPAAGGSVGCLS